MKQLGETAWLAKARQHCKTEQPCPDCAGRKFVEVGLGDGSWVTVDCENCKLGYEPPRGYVLVDSYKPDVDLVTVGKIESELVDGEQVSFYSGEGFYRVQESDLFECKLDALERAQVLTDARVGDENARHLRKEKDSRTWSWNATYHRRCIRQAEKDLAYHKSKLAVSLPHVKVEKETK